MIVPFIASTKLPSMIWFILCTFLVGLVIGGAFLLDSIIKCENCANSGSSMIERYKKTSESRTFREHNWSAEGWRSVSERVDSNSQHFDRKGAYSGHSTSQSWVNRTVPTMTDNYTDYFTCPDCNFKWTRNFSRTYDL